MSLLMLCAAALAYTVGGVFMKLSNGSRLDLILLAIVIVVPGIIVQTFAMRHVELGAAYMVVLGLEVALALLFSVLLFHEVYSPVKVSALALIVAGIVLLQVADRV